MITAGSASWWDLGDSCVAETEGTEREGNHGSLYGVCSMGLRDVREHPQGPQKSYGVMRITKNGAGTGADDTGYGSLRGHRGPRKGLEVFRE